MTLDVFYAAVGGDSAQVLDRLPSEALVRRFLAKFPADPSYAECKAALAARDLATAFRAAHTLKGTAANLGLDTLAATASDLTEALRPADTMPEDALISALDDAYAITTTQLAKLNEEAE